MKKALTSLILAGLLAVAMIVPVSAAESEEIEFARYTATANDPFVHYAFDSDLDRGVTTWAVIKYRTITETDDCGSPLKGQLYAEAKEPHCVIDWNHSKEWETVVLDLLSTYDGSDEIWTTCPEPDFRFDMMESNRDALTNSDEDPKVVVGSQIDIAYVAFYNTEEDAKAGTNMIDIVDAKELATEGYVLDGFEVELLSEKYVAKTEAPVTDNSADIAEKAPQTFDAGVIAGVAAIISAAGYALSKKR